MQQLSSSPFVMGKSTAASTATKDRLRAASTALRSRGVDDPDELLRIGAAVMAERCCAAFDERDTVGAGWLAEAVRHGGAWATVQALAPADQAPSRFAEYDKAAGL
jgi:hypothetical protein